MSRNLSVIVGLGIVTAIFMAVMSMFYLQQIPTKEDLHQLEDDLRREHGLYLDSMAPLDLELIRPEQENERTSLRITCTLRPDIRQRTKTIDHYLARMADSVLEHPTWRGRLARVTVAHTPPGDHVVTRVPAATEPAGKS